MLDFGQSDRQTLTYPAAYCSTEIFTQQGYLYNGILYGAVLHSGRVLYEK